MGGTSEQPGITAIRHLRPTPPLIGSSSRAVRRENRDARFQGSGVAGTGLISRAGAARGGAPPRDTARRARRHATVCTTGTRGCIGTRTPAHAAPCPRVAATRRVGCTRHTTRCDGGAVRPDVPRGTPHHRVAVPIGTPRTWTPMHRVPVRPSQSQPFSGTGWGYGSTALLPTPPMAVSVPARALTADVCTR